MTDSIRMVDAMMAFMAAITRHQVARWSPQSGIELVFQLAEHGYELMLQIHPGKHYPGLYRRLLERRYQQAAEYDGCHLCLNGSDVLILWWPLPPASDSYAQRVEQLFALAELTLPPVATMRAQKERNVPRFVR
ncbi:HrpV family type III secretion system protein [Dickeya oryzae]|uniref:HrpV family type III secretion system protein n=1 Tax=Dickeya oryzae TaxID=1240404 RepID=A0AB39I8K8_9GAMM|nr:HrpV family type III secretion system protein [Dickeya oryzae]MCA6996315.1 hypothetical protein [Dickeya oryzae]